MTRRLMMVLAAVLAVLMLAGTGCVRNQTPRTTVDGYDPYADNLDIQYDEWGNPIDPLGARGDLAELSAGQFEAVYFEYDSPQLNPAEQSKINTAISYLHQNPTSGIIVEGHCDERGSNEYNLALGERRALAVRAYMISNGIDGARVQTRSYGEERPVAFGHDEASWRLNRRAEFVLTQM